MKLSLEDVKNAIHSHYALFDDNQLPIDEADEAMNAYIVSLEPVEREKAWDYKQDVQLERDAEGLDW